MNNKLLFSLCITLFILSKSVFTLEDDDYAFDPEMTFNREGMVIDRGNAYFDNYVSSKKIINELGFGWNLGNTFDAWSNSLQNQGLSSETSWGNPETTIEMIDALAAKGFKAIRIPVTWHNHLIDDKYTVDPEWMRRVKTVVDWCISRGLYVILNTHHDNCDGKEERIKYGEGYYPLLKDAEESEKFLYNVWVQIATAFNNGYDHHLIFEGLNEPRTLGMQHEWYYTEEDEVCVEAALVLNEFYKIIHKAIRETGGNNEKRFIMITALYAGYDSTINSPLAFPDDSKYNPTNNKLLLSVHMYTPYELAMRGDTDTTEFTPADRAELYEKFSTIYKKFVEKGIHVVVGEMGAVNKNNTIGRIEWGTYYVEACRQFQFSPFVWDNGYYDNSKTCDDIFGHFQRSDLTWENGNYISALIKAGNSPLGEDSQQIYMFEPLATYNKTTLLKDFRKPIYFDNDIDSKTIIDELGFGWNLGNTFDAWEDKYDQGLNSETCWGNPRTSPKLIDALVKAGFKAIRIPVTWHNHLVDKSYTIDPEWMNRVKTVVDWCIDKGLYVIINTHHDNAKYKKSPIRYGKGYYPLKKDAEESEKFIYNVWKQISTAFNNGYDHHLIFETLNEPRMMGLPNEWWYDPNNSTNEEAALMLNEYNKLAVKAIRESGGNNEKRFIMLPALAAGYDSSINSPFQFPDDSKYNPSNNKLLFSVHMYAPYDFAMKPDMELSEFTIDYRAELYDKFTKLYKKFINSGYHVVIGEMGAINKNNTQARIAWGRYYLESCRQFQFSAFVWDNGYWNNSNTCDDIFGHLQRDKLEWTAPSFISALIRAGQKPLQDEVEFFSVEPVEMFDDSEMILDYGQKEFPKNITSKDIINDLGFGWNLGNTFDAWNPSQNQGLGSETCWGNPETTPELIDFLVKTGFKAIRIPVTWHNHLIDDKYTVDPQWMKRVKTVVDWCIERGLYVILNTHHDNAENRNASLKYGQGYYPLLKDIVESERFIYNVWKQIANAFNNGYDHHLIFEGLNEPRMIGLTHEWWYQVGDKTCEEAAKVLNEYHRLIHKAIRETGGNNAKRFIMITGLSAGYDATINSPLEFPNDSKYNPTINRLLLSVHMYAPYDLVMNPDMEKTEFTDDYREQLYDNFKQVYRKYVTKGIHVVIGEMGFVNKNNTQARIEWGKYYMNSCRKLQFSAFIWDNGYWDNTKTCDDIFGHLKRDKLEWENEELIKEYIKAGQEPLDEDPEVFAIEPVETYETLGMVIDHEEVEFNDKVTGKQIVDEMGFGWNLGNTFDAWSSILNQGLDSETCWGNPKTTEEMIDYLVKTGFKAIRIPVTWHNHLVDKKYTVDPEWMRRVKTVVDWCIKKGLYVILNTHHDNAEARIFPLQYGQGYYPLNKDTEESEKFIFNVWKQIATAFNNGYDHHLIFEGLNEPRLIGHQYEWSYNPEDWTCQEAASVLNEYHRLIHKAIRESGGNNAKRFIMFTPLAAGYDSTIRSPFEFPNDSKFNPSNNKLLLSVHMYAPYDFAMNPDMSLNEFTDEYKKELDDKFISLYYKYVQKGYSIVAGEMGAINKNNTQARIEWGKYYVGLTRRYQASTFLWDNGYWDNTKTCDDIFGHLQRDRLTWATPDVIAAWVNAGKAKMWENPKSDTSN